MNANWKPDILLIDGNNIFSRAFYVTQYHPGTPIRLMGMQLDVQAVYKALQMIVHLIQCTRAVSKLLVPVWVLDGGSDARKEMDATYKAQRKGHPPEFYPLLNILTLILARINIQVMQIPGVEADDIINTVCAQYKERCHIGIASADKDMCQLVCANVIVYQPPEWHAWDTKDVETKFEVPPCALRLYLALAGDKSDNIKGVDGVGPVRARWIINHGFRTPTDLITTLDNDGLVDVPYPDWFWAIREQKDVLVHAWDMVGLRTVPIPDIASPKWPTELEPLNSMIKPLKVNIVPCATEHWFRGVTLQY